MYSIYKVGGGVWNKTSFKNQIQLSGKAFEFFVPRKYLSCYSNVIMLIFFLSCCILNCTYYTRNQKNFPLIKNVAHTHTSHAPYSY